MEEASLLLPAPGHRDHWSHGMSCDGEVTDSECVQRILQTLFRAVADSRQKGYVNGKGFGTNPLHCCH
jgi:hypothetical protein